jgi:hypothetical protein
MITSLQQYFLRFGHIDFPSLGTLKWDKKEAQWIDGTLHAPIEHIIFETQTATKANKAFYNFLSESLNVSNEQASIQLDEFITRFKEDPKATITLGNFGILSHVHDSYQWESTYVSNIYFKDIQLGNVASAPLNEDVTSLKKDQWVVWSIILFVLALALILFKNI